MRAVSQIPVSFLYQSYFDSALEEHALLNQPTNELIVPSTKDIAQGHGYAVGVAGYSDAPVAFRFYGSEADSGVVICRPGQLIRPGKFDAFDYGLPFGWLGGGRAMILVAHKDDAILDLGSPRAEMVFHRTRIQIEASASPLPTLKRNWPLNFPWSRALRDATLIDQQGNPLLRVEPTRTLLRLRSQIAASVTVGLVFRGSNEFDMDSTGAVGTADLASTFVEVTFPASTDPLFAPYPTVSLPEDFLRLACDEGGLSIFNLGVAGIAGLEVDVVRFGRI